MVHRRTPHVPAEPGRRSQAERVEQMRARLLDATIACLAERGYSNTSTNDIVRRAHVSRGALAHHFRTRTELVSAAAQRLLESRAEEFRERFGAITPERRTPAEALNVLWSFYDDPGCVAMLELTVAARHEPELRSVLAPMPEQISLLTRTVFAEFFPDLARLPFLDEALRSINALFAGLAVAGLSSDDLQGHAAEVRAFVKILASLAPQFANLATT
jgi:AcrR family transcriptional regulator